MTDESTYLTTAWRQALDRCADLTSTQYAVATAICNSGDFRTGANARPSVKWIVRASKCSRACVYRAMNTLEEKGWIVRHTRPGRPTLYELAIPDDYPVYEDDEEPDSRGLTVRGVAHGDPYPSHHETGGSHHETGRGLTMRQGGLTMRQGGSHHETGGVSQRDGGGLTVRPNHNQDHNQDQKKREGSQVGEADRDAEMRADLDGLTDERAVDAEESVEAEDDFWVDPAAPIVKVLQQVARAHRSRPGVQTPSDDDLHTIGTTLASYDGLASQTVLGWCTWKVGDLVRRGVDPRGWYRALTSYGDLKSWKADDEARAPEDALPVKTIDDETPTLHRADTGWEYAADTEWT